MGKTLLATHFPLSATTQKGVRYVNPFFTRPGAWNSHPVACRLRQ